MREKLVLKNQSTLF